MDFVVELLIQLVWQIIGELVFDYLIRRLLRRVARITVRTSTRRVAQYTFSAVAGLAFGVAWGAHLAGTRHWPKLLWVSVALAVAAGVLARRRRHAESAHLRIWRYLVLPPWRWSHDRLFGLAIINVAIAIGIELGYGT